MWIRCRVCDKWSVLPHTCNRKRVTVQITSPHDPNVEDVAFTESDKVLVDVAAGRAHLDNREGLVHDG